MSTEPDQEAGAPHPRETGWLIGHEAAEATLAEAARGGRLHHAWLLTGPKGVGKATLAYRFARRLLGAAPSGPRPLDADPQDPVFRRVAQLAHPDLLVIRRGVGERGKARRDITAEEARALPAFFTLKPAEGGYRVAIIDAVDDMNRHAANAILKALEEPPPKAVLLLVCHAPGSMLPTIKSRCRRLALRPMAEADVAAAVRHHLEAEPSKAALRFARGRPGRAIALQAAGVADLEKAFLEALEQAARRGPSVFASIAFQGPGTNADRFGLLSELSRDWLWRAASLAAGAPAEAAPDRLMAAVAGAPGAARRLAEAHGRLSALESAAEGLDMDAVHAMNRIADILAEAVAEGPVADR